MFERPAEPVNFSLLTVVTLAPHSKLMFSSLKQFKFNVALSSWQDYSGDHFVLPEALQNP